MDKANHQTQLRLKDPSDRNEKPKKTKQEDREKRREKKARFNIQDRNKAKSYWLGEVKESK